LKLSGKTSSLVLEIKEYSGNKLKNEADVSLLIECSYSEEKQKLFEDMVFTAKYLNGLGKILHSNMGGIFQSGGIEENKIDEKAEEKIRNEFRQNMLKFTSQLSEIVNEVSGSERKNLSGKYLAMNSTSLVNLTNLIYDLSWVKKYMNSKKR
jgi:hypothetical protein